MVTQGAQQSDLAVARSVRCASREGLRLLSAGWSLKNRVTNYTLV